MPDKPSSGSAVKIELSESFMRWLMQKFIFPGIVFVAMGWVGKVYIDYQQQDVAPPTVGAPWHP